MHARKHKRVSALVVVSRIILTYSEGSWVASGGMITTHADPWFIDEAKLEATEYRYSITQNTPDNALHKRPANGAGET